MSMQRSIRTSLAGAIAFAVFGIASIATAQAQSQQTTQQIPPPPPPPPPPQQPAAPPPPAMPMPPPPPPSPQQPPPPQGMPSASQQGSSGQFYQGTQSSASYPTQNGTLTVNAGMPDQVKSYGPPPSFKSLDTNHDGHISAAEAQAYPPLDSDFLYASAQGKSISHSQYERWVKNQH